MLTAGARPQVLQNAAGGPGGGGGRSTTPGGTAPAARGPAEVDSHMLIDEETEFQISRLETQHDDLEDWSKTLQHQH
eukprot:SAG22_NODE_968_length_6253_cov_7.174033_3_plen_77_part_00